MDSTPQSESQVVRRASVGDVPQLTGVLTRAFAQDPFYNWLVPQQAERPTRLAWTFDLFLRRMSGDLNESYTTNALDSCAIWRRPGERRLSLLQQLQLLPAFARIMGLKRIPDGLKLLEAMDRVHESLAPEPHFYLFVLGVEPAQQRKGVGARLLEPILQQCDREGRRAMLETAQPTNLPFYERRGFRVCQIFERGDWPKFWFMTRDPR